MGVSNEDVPVERLFAKFLSTHNPAHSVPLQSNNSKPNGPHGQSVDVSMHLTLQCAGLGERESSLELHTYDSADIVNLNKLQQSHTLSRTSLNSVWLWHKS